jgi:hypothetical protein
VDLLFATVPDYSLDPSCTIPYYGLNPDADSVGDCTTQPLYRTPGAIAK